MADQYSRVEYTQRVLIAVGIVSAVVLIILFIGSAFKVILLVLAAVLVSVFFRGIARWIHHRIPIPYNAALAVSVLGVLLISVGVVWGLSPYVSQQAKQLVPTALSFYALNFFVFYKPLEFPI
ncbi:MAG: hypothetical protein HC880_15490 [Bacteroidia bacterium]|nr:hypothetical protein [Bacteroidia bacterium]